MDIRCTWVAGPDAGEVVDLGPGRHLVGRAPLAAARCDDPALEAHHAVLDVGDDAVVLSQLAGTAAVWAGGAPIDGPTLLRPPTCVEIGHSVLVVEAMAPPPPVTPTDDPEPDGGPGATLLAIGGAGLLAAGLREPRFLTFGLAGGAVPLSVLGIRWAAVRGRSGRHSNAGSPMPSLPAAATDVVVGVEPVDATGRPPRPVFVDLRPGRSLSVSGPNAEPVVRSVVAQLAAQGCGRPVVRRRGARTVVGAGPVTLGDEATSTLVTTAGPIGRLVADTVDCPLAERVHVVGLGPRR